MRVLLDEDVHIKLMDWFIGLGHDVARVPSGLKNGSVFELARRESRVLITRDKDFANRLLYSPSKNSGIIVLRIHPPQLEKLTAALQRLLSELSPASLIGKLVVLEEQEYHLLS